MIVDCWWMQECAIEVNDGQAKDGMSFVSFQVLNGIFRLDGSASVSRMSGSSILYNFPGGLAVLYRSSVEVQYHGELLPGIRIPCAPSTGGRSAWTSTETDPTIGRHTRRVTAASTNVT